MIRKPSFFTVHPYYGNLIEVPAEQPSHVTIAELYRNFIVLACLLCFLVVASDEYESAVFMSDIV